MSGPRQGDIDTLSASIPTIHPEPINEAKAAWNIFGLVDTAADAMSICEPLGLDRVDAMAGRRLAGR